MINSTYWDDLDEVAAFEELVGSHGGLGGTQSLSRSFSTPPTSTWPREQVVGAEGVYHVFKHWQAQPAGGGSSGRITRCQAPGPRFPASSPATRSCELLRRAFEVLPAPPCQADREERSPVNRHDQSGPDQAGRLGGALGVHVAGAESVAPAPDRKQGKVDIRNMIGAVRRRGRCHRRSRCCV